MKNILSALGSLTLLCSLVVGCGNAVETAPEKATASDACVRDERAGNHEYVFSAGSAHVARVVRSTRADGSETLSGVTKSSRGTLTEVAELARDGRLEYADMSFVGENGATRRVVVDAKRGAFYVQDGRGAAWNRLPTDEPWVIAGLMEDESAYTLAPSPVGAWIAARAAKVSPNLRIVDANLRQSVVATADQYVVDGEEGERFVVAGSSAMSANDEFITGLGEDASPNPTRVMADSLRPHRTAQR